MKTAPCQRTGPRAIKPLLENDFFGQLVRGTPCQEAGRPEFLENGLLPARWLSRYEALIGKLLFRSTSTGDPLPRGRPLRIS